MPIPGRTQADVAREIYRLQQVADVFHLQSSADLKNFLDKDPKTCYDATLKAQYLEWFQEAVPRLRE